MIIRSIVDFPQPFGPMMPTLWFRRKDIFEIFHQRFIAEGFADVMEFNRFLSHAGLDSIHLHDSVCGRCPCHF